MEEVAEAMSIDKSTRVDTVPRAVASEVVLEEQPEPAPVLSKRLIVICVVALFLIVIFGGALPGGKFEVEPTEGRFAAQAGCFRRWSWNTSWTWRARRG